MRPFPAAVYQGKSHVPSSNLKRYLTHLLQLIKFPKYISHLRGTPSFPAQFNLRAFSPHLDMRVDSPALSGRDPDLPITPPEEASLTLKLERKCRGTCHIRKDTNFPVHSRKVPMPGHLFKCNPEDEVTTRSGTDTPVASSRKSCRFQIQLYKWPEMP